MSNYPTIPFTDERWIAQGNALEFHSSIELRWKVNDPRIRIGRGTYGAPKIVMYHPDDRLEVGNFCSIAGGSYLLAGGEHVTSNVTTYPFSIHYKDSLLGPHDVESLDHPSERRSSGIVIGSDVWIGFRAMVLSGVSIGHGAVLGAGCVVAKDVPPYAVVVGNPGRVIKYRFSEAVIAEMLSIRWWDWRLDKILKFAPLLESSPDSFLTAFRRLSEGEVESFYRIPIEENQPRFRSVDQNSNMRSRIRRISKGCIPAGLRRTLRKFFNFCQ